MAAKEDIIRRKPKEISYITPKRLDTLIRVVESGRKLRTIPFKWDYTTRTFDSVKEPKHLFIWYCNIAGIFLYVSFLMVRVIQVNLDENISLKRRLFTEFGAILYMFPLVFQLTFFFYKDDYPTYMNQSVVALGDYKRLLPSFTSSSGKEPWELMISNVIHPVIRCCLFGADVLLIGMSILNPRNPIFISSLLDEPNAVENLPVRIFSTLVIIFMAQQYKNCGLMIFIPNVIILFPYLVLINVLRTTESNQEKLWGNVIIYRQMQLVIAKFNMIHGPVCLPFVQVILLMLSVYGFVGMMKLNGIPQVLLAAVGALAYSLLFLVLRGFAEASCRSEKLLSIWRRSCMLDKRVLRTLKPLRVSIGSYFFIDIGLILTSTDIIVSNTIGILML